MWAGHSLLQKWMSAAACLWGSAARFSSKSTRWLWWQITTKTLYTQSQERQRRTTQGHNVADCGQTYKQTTGWSFQDQLSCQHLQKVQKSLLTPSSVMQVLLWTETRCSCRTVASSQLEDLHVNKSWSERVRGSATESHPQPAWENLFICENNQLCIGEIQALCK